MFGLSHPGHLDLLDRLHSHSAYASVVLGLDGPSTWELGLLSEFLFAFPLGVAADLLVDAIVELEGGAGHSSRQKANHEPPDFHL